MSEKGSHAGEGADEGGDGAAELKKIELTEDELNAAISAFNKYDVDRRGVRLCDLKKIYEAMGETLRDEEMFNVRWWRGAPQSGAGGVFFSTHTSSNHPPCPAPPPLAPPPRR